MMRDRYRVVAWGKNVHVERATPEPPLGKVVYQGEKPACDGIKKSRDKQNLKAVKK